MLEKELTYFQQNQESIIKGHIGEYVLIVDAKVIGYHNTALDAYSYAISNGYLEGTFLIQPCLIGEDAYTAHFYSPVVGF